MSKLACSNRMVGYSMKTDWFVNPSKLFVKYELLLHTEVDVFMCLPLFSNIIDQPFCSHN